MPTYPDAARQLVTACDEYLRGERSLTEMKNAVWSTAQVIVAADERDVRDFLQSAEGQLDIAEHTTDSASLFEATRPVVSQVRERIVDYLSA